MAPTTTTTDSRMSDMLNAVPLLLSSFPTPPSYIPSNPLVPPVQPSSNPPLSLPPSAPLPPVPGPSPISEHETLMFISAARSRRASKLSVASSSSYSRRDSVATLASVASGTNSHGSAPSLSPSISITPLDSSSRSVRSFSSSGSLSASGKIVPGKAHILDDKINEEDPAELTRVSLDELSRKSPMPEHDPSEDEKITECGIPPSLSRRQRHNRSPFNDSISSIDMRDLPAMQDYEMDNELLVPFVSSISRSAPPVRSPITDKELPPLPLPTSAPPTSNTRFPRSDSPDIQAILASTPRPRRKSSSSARSRSQSRPRRTGIKRHVSEGQSIPAFRVDSFDSPRRGSAPGRTVMPAVSPNSRPRSPSQLPYSRSSSGTERWEEDSFVSDYGVPLDATGTPMELLDQDAEERLDRVLDGEGSDSDSSIDLHTPLPNLMLRHGLLSPNSKLLPKQSRPPSPDRHMSLLSVASTTASVMTKSGILKDHRDTERRRTRHRDGRLLRGGIGLTTGLGWSDSEDEDAPSPLTKRLSSLALSRQPSLSSLRPAHPLSRSVSDTLVSASDALAREGYRRKPTTSLPPTSWQRASTSSTSTSSSVTGGARSIRTSTSSIYSSAPSMRRTSESTAGPLEYIKEREESPSSASSISILTPVTPFEDEFDGVDQHSTGKERGKSPAPMRRIPSSKNLRSLPTPVGGNSSMTFPRSRTTSTSSTAANVGPSSLPTTTSAASRTPLPRSLRLPQSTGSLSSLSQPASTTRPSLPMRSSSSASSLSQARARAASGPASPPVPSLPSKVARPTVGLGLSQSVSPSTSPTSSSVPVTPIDSRKPRTGTGMVYRTGSGSRPGTRQSMMRMPSSGLLRATATGGGGGAGVGIAL